MGLKDSERKYISSKDFDLCEGCGEFKSIIIMERWFYYKYKLRYIVLPVEIIVRIIYLLLRLLIFPYLILKYKRLKK